jgi:hypothetical protein
LFLCATLEFYQTRQTFLITQLFRAFNPQKLQEITFVIEVLLLFVSNFIAKFGGILLFPPSSQAKLTALHYAVKRTFFLQLLIVPLFFMNFHEMPTIASNLLMLFFLPAL